MEDREKRGSLWGRLRRTFCLVTGSRCRIEAQGCRELIVQGCCAIEKYTPSCIVLRVHDPDYSFLHICGQALLCSSYHTDAVQLCGEISTLKFCKGLQETEEL